MIDHSRNFQSGDWFKRGGMALIALSLLLLMLTFGPILREELRYRFRGDTPTTVLTKAERAAQSMAIPGDVESAPMIPVDEQFGVVIPKIGANASIVPEVDWEDSAVYQRALTKGVAQARGTSTPDKPGNMFLFAHSGNDFYEVARYNAVFALLDKLVMGDDIFIFYHEKKIRYRVTEKRVVSASAVEYLGTATEGHTVTLMTCWPVGTTWKRLIVRAEREL